LIEPPLPVFSGAVSTALFTRLLCGVFLLSSAGIALARQDWIFDIRSGVLYDSNVSHSDRSRDVEADFAWRSLLTAGQGFQLTDDLRLGVFGTVEGQLWWTYNGLSNVQPGVDANLRYRFGLGRTAPWIRLGTKLEYADFQEARRSGLQLRPVISGGVSLTERIRLDASYEYERFDARDAVFERDAHSVSLHATFDVTSSTQLTAGYTYRHGDVTASAVPPRPDIVAIADVRELIDTFDEPYMAYRFPASTHAASIGLSQALSDFAALQATYQFQHTSHESLTYTNHIAEVALAFSF
jgi:opacity protein-like surface antigen